MGKEKERTVGENKTNAADNTDYSDKFCIVCSKPMDRKGSRCRACCDKRNEKARRNPDKNKCSRCEGSLEDPSFRVCGKCRKVNKFYTKEWRKKNAEAGLCSICYEPNDNGKKTCDKCLVLERERRGRRPKKKRMCADCQAVEMPPGIRLCVECGRRHENEAAKRARKKMKEKGLCASCGSKIEDGKNHCSKCRAKIKLYQQNLKKKVVDHYGGCCKCCAEDDLSMLTIDHINNDGNKHRSSGIGSGSGYAFYLWVKKNNFPADLQCLCFNCNFSKRIFGECAHKLNMTKMLET